jgi:protein-S-isoprenylcysteine O-methyltransferase Ste14
MDELRAFALGAIAVVFLWQLVGASRAFVPVGKTPLSRLSLLVGIAFAVVWAQCRSAELNRWAVIPGFIGLAAALGVFEWARRSIRGQFFSYILSDDVPKFVWNSGPYAYVRHPVYTSYMLALISAGAMFPTPGMLASIAATIVYFHLAARYEERKFQNSPLAADYAAYKRRSGRFFPRLRPSR